MSKESPLLRGGWGCVLFIYNYIISFEIVFLFRPEMPFPHFHKTHPLMRKSTASFPSLEGILKESPLLRGGWGCVLFINNFIISFEIVFFISSKNAFSAFLQNTPLDAGKHRIFPYRKLSVGMFWIRRFSKSSFERKCFVCNFLKSPLLRGGWGCVLFINNYIISFEIVFFISSRNAFSSFLQDTPLDAEKHRIFPLSRGDLGVCAFTEFLLKVPTEFFR